MQLKLTLVPYVVTCFLSLSSPHTHTFPGSNESFGDLYHVLSIAFLLMEEERETSQKQLRDVEDFFVKRAKHAGLISLQSIARKIMYREKR